MSLPTNSLTLDDGGGGLSTAISGTPSLAASAIGAANRSGARVKTATPSLFPFAWSWNICSSLGPSTVGGPTTVWSTPPTLATPARKPIAISLAKLSCEFAMTNATRWDLPSALGELEQAATAAASPTARTTASGRDGTRMFTPE